MNRKPTKNMNARKSLRCQSLKRQRLMRVAGPWRDEYLAGKPCVYLGCIRMAQDIHEIARGPARAASLMEPAALLCLCRAHHDEVQNWPVARQLALRKIVGPETYDRQRVNVLRGRQPDAITEEEVEKEMWNI